MYVFAPGLLCTRIDHWNNFGQICFLTPRIILVAYHITNTSLVVLKRHPRVTVTLKLSSVADLEFYARGKKLSLGALGLFPPVGCWGRAPGKGFEGAKLPTPKKLHFL